MNNIILPKETKLDLAHKGAKALLNLIPIAGGTVTEIFTLLVVSPIEKRRNIWMYEVVEALKKIEEKQNGIVQELANNEEFISILILASINATKTHQKEKHRYLKNALINSIGEKVTYDVKQIFIKFIDELTIQHIEILNFIRLYKDRIKSANGYSKIYNLLIDDTIDRSVPEISKIEITTFRYFIKDLEAKGLVFVSDDMREIEGQVHESLFLLLEGQEYEGLPFLKITDFGNDFLTFIETEK